jgi:arginine N-succinyltransferase
MFIIRQANTEDHASLLKLMRMLHPGEASVDPDEVARQINDSRESFAGRVGDRRRRRFVFVLEDTDTGGVVGASAVDACVCGPGEPRAFLRLRRREHYSDDLQSGQVHVTLQLQVDETPASELRGLVLAPPYRGHRDKLGSLLSLVRFHFIGLHRAWFEDAILAKLTPPPLPNHRDCLWEHLGRRFVNLRWSEARRFSAQSREFITALFPTQEVYASLLSPEARNVLGKVGPEAAAAQAMLKGIGFVSHGQVDPLDGGPILEARLDDVPLVREGRTVTLGDPAAEYPLSGFVSIGNGRQFRAVRSALSVRGDRIAIPGETAGLLGAHVGDTVGITPLQ